MKKALQILGIAIAVICALSITINNRPVFSFIYNAISPATTKAQQGFVAAYQFSAEKTRQFTRKLLDNSVPKTDSVKSKLAAPDRKLSGDPAEVIAPHEKEQLDDLIKTHR